MDKKIKSLWDVMVPQDTTDPEMRVAPHPERKKIVFTPDPDLKPLTNPNPIPINTGDTRQTETEHRPVNSTMPTNTNADAGNAVKPAQAVSEKTETGHRPMNTTSPPNSGAGTKKQEGSENFHSAKGTTDSHNESTNRRASDKNFWKVFAAVITLIIILGATYFINERIKENRKKRTDKNNDDFLDNFFDSKTGNIVRFSGIALLLLIAVLAILYSTRLLVKGFGGVQETFND